MWFFFIHQEQYGLFVAQGQSRLRKAIKISNKASKNYKQQQQKKLFHERAPKELSISVFSVMHPKKQTGVFLSLGDTAYSKLLNLATRSSLNANGLGVLG